MPVLPVFSAAPVQPPCNSYRPLWPDKVRLIRIEISPTVLLLRLLQASRTAHRNNLQPVIFDLNPNKFLTDAVFYSDSLISNDDRTKRLPAKLTADEPVSHINIICSRKIIINNYKWLGTIKPKLGFFGRFHIQPVKSVNG
jgi:hypothetical protein